MALDPRKFLAGKTNCPSNAAGLADSASKRGGFFDALGKIGSLEILNDIGFGKVREGLKTVTRVSDSIRTGKSVVPGSEGQELFNTVLGTAAASVEQGANMVLSTVGINPAIMQTVEKLNPAVANRALGQAKAIFQKVKSGEFNLQDIPEFFSDLQNLEILGRGIFTEGGLTAESLKRKDLCPPSPYATDLISYYPKYKFLFIVQFEYTTPYATLMPLGRQVAFVVKNSTRPNINYEYDEVNMYNFHTKVLKRMMYQPMTMRFYDDSWNNAMRFYNTYYKAVSPIGNMSFQQKVQDTGVYEEGGMSFGTSKDRQLGSQGPGGIGSIEGDVGNSFVAHEYSASIGPLADPVTKTVLKTITLYHVYREGAKMNVYNFFNPRITSLQLDELDMTTTGEGCEFNFEFEFDGLNIETGIPIESKATGNDSRYNIRELTSIGKFPLSPQTGGMDLTNGPFDKPSGPTTLLGGIVDGFRETVEGVASAVSNAVTGTISAVSNTIGGVIFPRSNAFNNQTGFTGSQWNIVRGTTKAIPNSTTTQPRVTLV